MSTPVEDPAPMPETFARDWRYWRTPVLFGVGFCALEVALFVVRFGFSDRDISTAGPVVWVPLLFGLVLFFAGGLLVGLFAQWMVRGCHGVWRTFLLVAIAIATPFAIVFSLVGGLLGPYFVVLYALVPYLLLVGFPVLIRKLWLRSRIARRPPEKLPGQGSK